MLFPSLSTKKKFVAALILGFQIFMPLAMPVHVAQAADTFANTGAVGGTPSSTGNVPTLRDWVTAPLESAQAVVSKAASATVGGVADATLGNALKFVGWIFFEVAGKFLQMMAYILDMSIDKTVDDQMYKNLSAINVGWTAIRDITNMFFIFVLLYISILTILGMAGSSTKSWVAHLIIAALLINFSLFATQVVVDAGNMLTVGFWNNIKTTNGDGSTTGGFAPIILEGLKMQTVFNGGEGSNVDKAKIYFGGAIFMFIAGYVVLAGAIMMIVRTVTLIILMIVSPFAFLGFALPKGGGFADTWLKKLIGATFVAPAFVMMLYINMIIVRSMDIKSLGGAGGSQFSAAFKGDVSNFAIIYNFMVMIILMLSSLYVAKKVSEDIGGSAGGWAKRTLGYGGGAGVAAIGIAGGRFGRQFGGSTGRMVQNSKKVDEWAKSKNWMVRNLATTAKRTGGTMAKSTWDVRNTGAVGALNTGLKMTNTGVSIGGPLQAGNKKSYETHGGRVGSMVTAGVAGVGGGVAAANRFVKGEAKPETPAKPGEKSPFFFKGTENEKKIIEKAKEIHAYNPEARELYLKDHGVDLTAPRNKEAANALKRDIEKNNAKETLKKAKTLEQEIADGKTTREAAKIEGKEIGEAVKEAMQKLTSTERADLAPFQKDNKHFIDNLNKSDFATIHRMELEGKYNGVSDIKDGKVVDLSSGVSKDISEGAMRSNNLAVQQYIMNPENQNRLTMIDQDAIRNDDSLMENYNRQVNRVKNKTKAYEEALKENTERNKAAAEQKKTDAIQSAFEMK